MRDRIEFYFFTVVRLLAFLVALIAFVASIGAGVMGVHLLTNKADVESHPFSFDYGTQRREEVEHDKKKLLSPDNQGQPQQTQQPESTPSSPPQNQKQVQIDRLRLEVFEQLRLFVKHVEPTTPDTSLTFNLERASQDDDTELAYLSNLKSASTDLAKDAEFYKNNSFVQDPVHEVYRFLSVYRDAYVEYVSSENSRIQKEQARILAEKAGALAFLYAAGIAFGIFTVWTMILVFLRIEINTRQTVDLLSKSAT